MNSFPRAVICFVALLLTVASSGFTQQAMQTNIAGGIGGTSFADSEIPSGGRILEVQVSSGKYVDSVQITYELPDGRTVIGRRNGGPGGDPQVFRLDSDEYITGIAGRYGEYIDSIVLQTNKRTSTVLGGPGGERDYRINVAPGYQAIGFIGRGGKYIDAIGLLAIPVNIRQISESQIFGGNGGEAFSDREVPLGARISQIRVQAGQKVDGIQAVYSLPNGSLQDGPYHGGRGGDVRVFQLDPDEYVTGISGRCGIYIDSIAIRTNKRISQVFGGRGGNRDFAVNLPSGKMAIGFSGRSGKYLDAIGLTYTDSSAIRNLLRRLPGRNRNR